MGNGELRMANDGVEKRASAAHEDVEGICKLPQESLVRGKVKAQLQPALAGE